MLDLFAAAPSSLLANNICNVTVSSKATAS